MKLTMRRYRQKSIFFSRILQLHYLNTGQVLRTFPLDLGIIIGFTGKKKYSEIFYQFTSFLTPGIIYTIDLQKDQEPRVSIHVLNCYKYGYIFTIRECFFFSKLKITEINSLIINVIVSDMAGN